MTGAALLTFLRDRGVNLWVESGKLLHQAPEGALTKELLDAIIEQEPTLIELLTNRTHGNQKHKNGPFDHI